MDITFFGHSAFGIHTNGYDLVVDPFITPNAQAQHIDIEKIKAHFLLITHGHGDHVADVEAIASKNKATIISNFEIVTHYQSKGIEGYGMNHGGHWEGPFGLIKMVNAVHSSSFPDGSYAGNPAGFILRNDEATVYIAGDTAATRDMELIPEMGFNVDIAIFPIGDTFTMGYKEAVLAAKMVRCKHVIGCHYDTFPPIQINRDIVSEYFENNGVRLTLMDIGETLSI
jgi:L-ascorbate metabolism protein UlaG (beta-lactamase superfamily)